VISIGAGQYSHYSGGAIEQLQIVIYNVYSPPMAIGALEQFILFRPVETNQTILGDQIYYNAGYVNDPIDFNDEEDKYRFELV